MGMVALVPTLAGGVRSGCRFGYFIEHRETEVVHPREFYRLK